MRFAQARLSHLIYGGVLALLVVVFWLAQGRYVLLDALEQDFARMQQVARTGRVATGVVERLSALSVSIGEYVASNAVVPAERIAVQARALAQAIRDARAELPAESAEIGRLAVEADRYRTSFDDLVAVRVAREERLNRLAQAAGSVRALADAAGQQVRFMQLRDAEHDFLLTRNAASRERVTGQLADLDRALPARGANDAVAEYQRAFARVAESVGSVDRDAMRALDAGDTSLRTLAAALVARAQAEEGAAVNGFRDTLAQGIRRNFEVFLLAVAIACACAFLLLRFVIRPLARMTTTMTAIAGGDYSQPVPYAGRRDEIGQMARSLSTFRTAMLELTAAQAQAEAASRHKSDFIANISHELRTPLNAIIGLSDMLLEDADQPDSRELKESLPRIGAAAKHLLGLINELLDLSTIEAGRMNVELTRFSPASLAEESVATLAPIARQKGLALQVSYPDDLPELESDAQRVRQILINLLGNAIKFTDTGDVRLEVSAAGGRVRFAVDDTGPGIAQEDIGRLFQEFTQLDASPTRKFGGSGLGLALSRRMARLIGGDVTLASEVGRGSTFVLELPQVAPAALARGGAGAQGQLAAGSAYTTVGRAG
jgi:signal transduction histidine kinase